MQQMIHKCCVLLGKKFGSFDRGFKVYQAYIGSSKSISLSVQEILAKEFERKESYFTYDSYESEEESEEEGY